MKESDNSMDGPAPEGENDGATPRPAKWSLDSAAFEKLLTIFSTERDEAGFQYVRLEKKLIRYFEWRAVPRPKDFSDETFNRMARRIEEGQTIENPQSYAYGIARVLVYEYLKKLELEPVPLDDVSHSLDQKVIETPEPDLQLNCLDGCLDSMLPESKELVLTYYQEDRRAKIELRQQLADSLQIPINALRIRAHRIRAGLEKCVRACLQEATA